MCYAVRLCAGELIVAHHAGDVQRLNNGGRRLSGARCVVQVFAGRSLGSDAGVNLDLGADDDVEHVVAVLPHPVQPK